MGLGVWGPSPSYCLPLLVYTSSPCISCSRFRLLPTSCISMPVHAHFRDLAVPPFAEHRAACVHSLTGAATAEGAAEPRDGPWLRLEHLATAEAHIGSR